MFDYEDCFEERNGKMISKTCCYQEFPSSRACGNILLCTVRTRSNSTLLKPKIVFCYQPISKVVEKFLNQKEFFSCIDHWKNIDLQDELYRDVYDAQEKHRRKTGFNVLPFYIKETVVTGL